MLIPCEVKWEGEDATCKGEAVVNVMDIDGDSFNVCRRHRDMVIRDNGRALLGGGNWWHVTGKAAIRK